MASWTSGFFFSAGWVGGALASWAPAFFFPVWGVGGLGLLDLSFFSLGGRRPSWTSPFFFRLTLFFGWGVGGLISRVLWAPHWPHIGLARRGPHIGLGGLDLISCRGGWGVGGLISRVLCTTIINAQQSITNARARDKNAQTVNDDFGKHWPGWRA